MAVRGMSAMEVQEGLDMKKKASLRLRETGYVSMCVCERERERESVCVCVSE